MMLTGTVRNVIDFGAFVDIGVKQDGLVHISELSDKFVRNPNEVVAVGDIVEVRVKEVDLVRKRIALSMKKEISSDSPEIPTEKAVTNKPAERVASRKPLPREARPQPVAVEAVNTSLRDSLLKAGFKGKE